MYRKRKGLLRKSFIVSVCFCLVLYRPYCLEAVYEITESELMAIEENNRMIVEKLTVSAQELERAETELNQAEKELETLQKQLQIQTEYYSRLEYEKNLLIKWGIPAAVVVAAGCFAGGLVLGLRL